MSIVAAKDGLVPERPGPPGTLLFENDQIRIWELILGPGEYCLWHEHPYDHLLVVVDGAEIEGVFADGQRATGNIEDKQIVYVPKGKVAETARNLSKDRTLRELIIDLKVPALDDNAMQLINFFQAGVPTTARKDPVY